MSLFQVGKVDHCILVDEKEKLIFGSVEHVPIDLTERSLRLCGGPRVPRLKVKEVRRLCEKREPKRKLQDGSSNFGAEKTERNLPTEVALVEKKFE